MILSWCTFEHLKCIGLCFDVRSYILYYYILYSSFPLFSSFLSSHIPRQTSSFIHLLLLPAVSSSPNNPFLPPQSIFSPSSRTIPILPFLSFHSIRVGTSIGLFISCSSGVLTPHVLSEWMVEVCLIDVRWMVEVCGPYLCGVRCVGILFGV